MAKAAPKAAKASKTSKATKPAATKPKPLSKPKTYPEAIVAVVIEHGLISRAAFGKAVAGLGSFDSASHLKTALKKAEGEDRIKRSGVSYVLGTASLSALGPAAEKEYASVLANAENVKADQKSDEAAKKQQTERKYAANLSAAGGLSTQAMRDKHAGFTMYRPS